MNIKEFPGAPYLDDYYALALYAAEEIHRRIVAAGKGKVELEDLKQEALLGLVQAKGKYDPRKGAKFTTFAWFYIRAAIIAHLRRLDPLTTSERQKIKKLEHAREELTKSLQREPQVSELAKHLEIPEYQVRQWQSLRVVQLSLEGSFPIDPEKDEAATVGFRSPFDDPETGLLKNWETEEKAKLAEDVNDCLESTLGEVERSIVIFRVLGELTLEVVGWLRQMPIATVARWQMKAMSKLKDCLQSKTWQTADILQLLP